MILQELDFDELVQDNVSFAKLKTIGFPNNKVEDYRHINIKEIIQKQLSLLQDENINDIYKNFTSKDFYFLIFINQKPAINISNLSDDISFTQKDKDNKDYNNAMSLLSESFCKQNNVLSINKNLDKPMMIINITDKQDTFLANNLHIHISNNACVDILEIFTSTKESSCISAMNREFDIKEATLNYTKLNISSKQDVLNINNKIHLYKSKLNISTIEQGSKQSINTYEAFLEKEDSFINIYAISNITDKQNISNTIKIHHNTKNTHSNQIFKHILDEDSRAVFNSTIIIKKGSSYSVAHQDSQSILLSDNARVFNEPKMMIFTDELEASHGATVGSLNEEAINYMKLRGLSGEQCENILIKAFSNEIYEYIKNDLIKEYILEKMAHN